MALRLLGVPVLAGACACRAATFYVSPAGSDARTAQQAQSEEMPWQSVATALDAVSPGDTVVLLPGTHRQGDIVVTRSGKPEAPITLRARAGAILSGGTRLTEWARVQDRIYRSAPIDLAPFEKAKVRPTILFEDGVFLNQDHGQRLETMRPGSCLWDKENRQWLVWTRAGGEPGVREIELPTIACGITVAKGARHLVFEGLDMRFYNECAFRCGEDCGDIVFRGCRFGDCTRRLLAVAGDHVRVERCRFEQCGSTGLGFGGPGAFECVAADCVARQCANCYYAAGGARDILFERCEASHFARRAIPHFDFSADGDAIGIGISSGVVVRHCFFHDSGWAAYATNNPVIPWGKKTIRPNDGTAFDIWRAAAYRIESNVTARCRGGVHIAPGTDGVVVGNTIADVEGGGISAHGSTNGPVRGLVIDGNTVVGCRDGVWLSKVTSQARVVNNILAGNARTLTVQNPEGFFADHNGYFGTDATDIISWLGQAGDLAWARQQSGMDAHSIQAAPRFVDAAGGDFRLAADSPCRGRRADGGDLGANPPRPIPRRAAPATRVVAIDREQTF